MAYGDLLKSLLGTQFDDYRNQIMADDPYSSSSAMFARALQPTGNTTNDLIGTGIQGLLHGFTQRMGQNSVNERLMPVYGALNQALMGGNVADLQTNPDLQRFAPTLLAIQAAQKQDQMEREKDFQQKIQLEAIKAGMDPGNLATKNYFASQGVNWQSPQEQAIGSLLGGPKEISAPAQVMAQSVKATPATESPAPAAELSKTDIIKNKNKDRINEMAKYLGIEKALDKNLQLQQEEGKLWTELDKSKERTDQQQRSVHMQYIDQAVDANDLLSSQLMVVSMVKMYDANSIVRGDESDQMSEAAQSGMEQLLGKKWRSFVTGESVLTPAARQSIYNEAIKYWNAGASDFASKQSQLLEKAKGRGLIPEAIDVENFKLYPTYAERLAQKQSEAAAKQAIGGDVNREQVKAEISSVAKELGIKPELALKIAQTESNFDPNAKSPVGATGVYQLMAPTAKELGVDPTDPKQNIRGGLTYFKQLLTKYNGDEEKALAAYNWGMGNVAKASPTPTATWEEIKSKAPAETQNYVNKILGVPETKAAGGKYYKKVG